MKKSSPYFMAVRGLIGTIVIVLVVLASLNFNKLPLVGNSDVIHVEFADAGGLVSGDVVVVSGAQVGRVRSVSLRGDKVVADVVLTDSGLDLGTTSHAKIVTVTLLGRAAVELEPAGPGRLSAGDTIPVARTSSPYNLTATLGELTTTTSTIDKTQLAKALSQVSSTLNGTKGSLGPALNGITLLTRAVQQNDVALSELLNHAAHVTGVLASRNAQIATLLTSGNDLLTQLDERQAVVVGLLTSAKELANQLNGLVSDNQTEIGPALKQLDHVVELLNSNKQVLQQSISGLVGYATAFSEASSSGPWFDAFIQNLTSPGTLAPILSGALQ